MHEHTEIDSNTPASLSFKKKSVFHLWKNQFKKKMCKFMIYWAHIFKQIMAEWEH